MANSNPTRISTTLTDVIGISVRTRLNTWGISLILTRFLIAADVWARRQVDFRLVKPRICYELAQIPLAVEIKGEGRGMRLVVIPDGWLLFERMKGGVHESWFPVLLEIDRGTQDQVKFRERLEARIEFIQSGAYKRLFGQEAVTIAYVTTGERGEYRETRRRAMCEWTKDSLVKARREKWAPLFRFASVCLEDIYENQLFERAVWDRPDQDRPVGLFEG